MLLADGVLKIYRLTDTSESGSMPKEALVRTSDMDFFYSNRTVGYTRQYAAMGADQRIDRLVRIWDTPVEIGQYVVLDNTDQYRIDNVQLIVDDEGLRVVDLTLRKLEENYDVLAEQAEELPG